MTWKIVAPLQFIGTIAGALATVLATNPSTQLIAVMFGAISAGTIAAAVYLQSKGYQFKK